MNVFKTLPIYKAISVFANLDSDILFGEYLERESDTGCRFKIMNESFCPIQLTGVDFAWIANNGKTAVFVRAIAKHSRSMVSVDTCNIIDRTYKIYKVTDGLETECTPEDLCIHAEIPCFNLDFFIAGESYLVKTNNEKYPELKPYETITVDQIIDPSTIVIGGKTISSTDILKENRWQEIGLIE